MPQNATPAAVPSADTDPYNSYGLPRLVLFFVFTISGISALIYQLVWQRSLLTIYGSNIESVTIVVTAFMFGLGFGSLVGGWVSKRPNVPLLFLFSMVEYGIALYGAFSLHLFYLVGNHIGASGTLITGLMSFLLILAPTMLMGSTLPLLVAHFVNVSKSVGYSVSMLYFVNTLGAGLGAFIAAFLLLGALGLTGAVYVAVCLNFIAATLILLFRKRGGA